MKKNKFFALIFALIFGFIEIIFFVFAGNLFHTSDNLISLPLSTNL